MCYDFLIDITIVHTSKNDKCAYNRIFNTLKAAFYKWNFQQLSVTSIHRKEKNGDCTFTYDALQTKALKAGSH